MDEVCPRRATVSRILHQIVGDRRAASVGRSGPCHGQLGIATCGYDRRWTTWHRGGRCGRCRAGRWQTDANGVLGDDFDYVARAIGQARDGA